MNLRNKATVLLIDQIETVQVSFSPYVTGLTKLYTYKAKKGTYKAGDLALVLSPDQKYKVVEVQHVDASPTIDPYAQYEYQWLVQPIDMTQYERCMAAEEVLMEHLRNAQRTKLINEVQTELKEALPAEVNTQQLSLELSEPDSEGS